MTRIPISGILKILLKVSLKKNCEGGTKMKQESIAHFEDVRMKNKRIIRNLLRDCAPIGKTELSQVSGLSFPTVSSALNDLVGSGEALVLDEGSSKGGRPAAAFTLNPEFQYAACGYLEQSILSISIYNGIGHLQEVVVKPIEKTDTVHELVTLFEEIKEKYNQLTAIAIGIPGVVWRGTIKHLPKFPELEGKNLKGALEKELGVAVFLENDMNTIVYAERRKWADLAHIFINKEGCIGTGILINGGVLRGAHGYAGELEYICNEKDEVYDMLTQAISALACILDVPHIALSGEKVEILDKKILVSKLGEIMPIERLPAIHIVVGEKQLYLWGLWEMILEDWKSK